MLKVKLYLDIVSLSAAGGTSFNNGSCKIILCISLVCSGDSFASKDFMYSNLSSSATLGTMLCVFMLSCADKHNFLRFPSLCGPAMHYQLLSVVDSICNHPEHFVDSSSQQDPKLATTIKSLYCIGTISHHSHTTHNCDNYQILINRYYPLINSSIHIHITLLTLFPPH